MEWRNNQRGNTRDFYLMFCGGRVKTMSEDLVSDFVVAKETYGVATALYGTCKRHRKPHTFQLVPKLVKKEIRDTLHGNAKTKLYAVDYQLTAAIQVMGCGSLDAIKLAGFLELPCGQKIEKHLRRIEEVMGPIQERLRVASEMEAVEKESATAEKKTTSVHMSVL